MPGPTPPDDGHMTAVEHLRAAEALLHQAHDKTDFHNVLPAGGTDPRVDAAVGHALVAIGGVLGLLLADKYVGDGEHVNELHRQAAR